MIEQKEIAPVINRLFKTRDGEIVMEYLAQRFYDCKIKDETLCRQIGQRDVVHFLKSHMEAK